MSRWRWWAAAVLAGTVWLLWPIVRNGFVLGWDDDTYLLVAKLWQPVNGRVLWRIFTTLEPAYYHPLALLSHVLEYSAFGDNAPVAHAITLALHVLNTGLVMVLAAMLTRRIPTVCAGECAVVVLLTGAVFGWHPMQVESVAWLAERKTVMCAGFMLGAVCAYLRAADGGRRWWWWLAILFFVAALLSKPMAVTLPVVVLALDVYPLRRWPARSWRRLVWEKWLWVALAGVFAVLAVIGQRRAGATWSSTDLGTGTRLVLAARAIVFYGWKILWPVWLSPFYPQSVIVTLAEKEFWVPIVVVSAAAVGCVVSCRHRPWFLALGLSFVAVLLPVCGLAQVGGQAVADRFVYLAIVPATLGLAGLGIFLWRQFSKTGRAALVVVTACELLFFAARTREQIPLWHDELRLWENAREHYPENGLINLQLAIALSRRGRYEEALPCIEIARDQMDHIKFTHSTLGLIYLRLRRPAEAVPALELALAKDPQQRGARFNLACAYALLNRPADACQQLQWLLAEFPDAAPAVKNEPVLQRLDCRTGTP